MAGIYLHIPFCRQACTYCNFHFSTSLRYKNELVAALLKEMELQHENNYLEGATIETIYFGGGTPSLLAIDDVRLMMEALQQHFTIDKNAEITLEANPDDLSPEKLNGWKQLGINRLSIGIQSLYDEDLQWMNRSHTAEEAKAAISRANAAGFEQLTVDLIYGTPGLTDERWQKNIEWVLEQGINHLSCYALTVEPKTPLHQHIKTHQKTDVDLQQQSRQFIQLMNYLQDAGFEHYEISNFARPGYRSRHNSSYWKGTPYLGLGPSAHSFNGNSRQWNIANNQQYILSLEQNNLRFERETLSPTQQLNEYIMTSLRLMEGCDLQLVAKRFGTEKSNMLEQGSKPFIQQQQMVYQDHHLILTQQGKLFADGIAADLFFE